jgi:homopolymeric O-antigen transport system ATP-binding protein
VKEAAIIFDRVSKSYPMYHHITGGVKNLVFNFPKAISQIRNARFEVLKDLSFEVYRGETFGIIGRNGAGKSTILGLIAGVLTPSANTITVRGRVSPLLELGAGFHPELTGRENIMLNGVLLGLTRSEVLEKTDAIIDFSEIRDFVDQPIRTYSSGMLARLGFSVISFLEPEILLIDEVLAVGDIGFKKKCFETMFNFKKRGVTIVFVSHLMKDVELICDRAAWIDNHQLKMIGSASDVVAAFRGALDR